MGEFINVLVSKGKSNLIPEKDNLYGQFVGEWDFEWVDNQGTTGERHVQGEWIFAWVLEGTAIQDVFICPSRKARIKDYQPDAAYATAVRMYNLHLSRQLFAVEMALAKLFVILQYSADVPLSSKPHIPVEIKKLYSVAAACS